MRINTEIENTTSTDATIEVKVSAHCYSCDKAHTVGELYAVCDDIDCAFKWFIERITDLEVEVLLDRLPFEQVARYVTESVTNYLKGNG